jgi:hypothetical protein
VSSFVDMPIVDYMEDVNMCRLDLPIKKIVLIAIIFSVSHFSAKACLSAETYDSPETNQVSLAWDANDPSPDGYYVYQRTEGQVYDYSQPVVSSAVNAATVYNLVNDTTYYFVVRAYVGTDVSGDSNEVSFMAPSSSTASYTIFASASGDGSISPVGTVTVAEGSDQSFAITPGSGSYINDVWVDGVSIGALNSYSFIQVAQNHTISVDFAYYTHTISASSGTGGSISPTGNIIVSHGSSQDYTITADAGYQVADILVDGISVGPLASYAFEKVVEDHTIQAKFIAQTFTITAAAGTNGSISPAGSVNVAIGSDQTFAIIPNSGNMIADVWVDGVSVGAIDSYTFSNTTADHTINASFVAENKAPTVDAGPNQTVKEGQTSLLSGLNSTDPDDGMAAFQWRQIQGDPVTLSFPNEPETTFTTPNVEDSGAALIFELSVTDYAGSTSTDTCIVNVTWMNTPPIADAGADQAVAEGSQVVLNASDSYDADDGIASYRWIQISGPVVTLSDSNSASPAFIAPDVDSASSSLAFEVTVTDAGGLQDTDTCLINVTCLNTPPVADAGMDQNVTIGDEVNLDGSKSHDADDSTITAYRWRQTKGFPIELSDATAMSPMFVIPAGAEDGGPLTFELTVTDSGGLKAKDSCQIIVQPTGPQLHVSSITMELKFKGLNVEANAYVTILDDSGSIAKEASVSGNWTYNGNPINTATSTTRGNGVARLDSATIRAESGAVLALEVTYVSKVGHSYVPASNTATGGTLVVP